MELLEPSWLGGEGTIYPPNGTCVNTGWICVVFGLSRLLCSLLVSLN